jgi:MFS family permease
MTAGSTFGLGCLLVSQAASAIGALAAALLLIAPAAAALGPLGGGTLTVRWFDRGRGRALGVITAASSAGGLVVAPLVSVMLNALGWRSAVAVFGLVGAALIVSLAYLSVRDPERPAGTVRTHGGADRKESAGAILAMRDFWFICCAFGLLMGVGQATLLTIVPHMTDRGVTSESAALLISILASVAFGGKLLTGLLAERFDNRVLLTCGAALMGAFQILLLFSTDYLVVSAGCVAMGLGMGAMATLWGLIVAERFGGARFGTVMGLIVPFQLPLTLALVAGSGSVYDATGSYSAFFASAALASVLAAFAATLVRPPASPCDGVESLA